MPLDLRSNPALHTLSKLAKGKLMTNDETAKKEVECPMCGGINIEEIKHAENSYGTFVTIYLCKDCDVEFEIEMQM